MQPFEFHSELFEFRGKVLDTLAAHGFVWLSDFGSVDLMHDTYGLEVTGIREQNQARQIYTLLRKLFPDWRFVWQYYEDQNRGEIGWKVIISRERENSGGDWKPENSFPRLDTSAAEFALEMIEETIEAYSKLLPSPNLSDTKRAQLEKNLNALREAKRLAESERQHEKRDGGEE